MDANQYKWLKEHGNVLDFATLNATCRILVQRDEAHLAGLITRILSNGKIDSPSLHNAQQDGFTDFYRVSLATEDVAAVTSILFDYETEVVDIDPSAAGLTDRWNDLHERTKR